MSKSIMVLGTASGVGKSTVALGLCRILREAGYKVAPFKAQNISDNAHHCADGREMARSQALQAYACGLEPEPDMNPILLKMGPGGTQIFLGGVSAGNVGETDYGEIKKHAEKYVLEPYRRLEKKADIIVLEGAGSPVEMNLKAEEIVNMRTAVLTDSPVVLVADISAGGAYASVYGTLMLLSPEERARVKGVIINKISGHPESFEDIRVTMEKITNVPVLGFLPYTQLAIEDEDGLIDAHTGPKGPQSAQDMEREFSRLADIMRRNLNMSEIMRIINKVEKEREE